MRSLLEGHGNQHIKNIGWDGRVRPTVWRSKNAVATGKTAAKIANIEQRRPGSIATGGKGTASQCIALVSSIYAFAIARGLCIDNPAKGVKKAPVRKVDRFLSEAEIGALAEALDAEAVQSGNPYPSAAIKLLLLTGCRKARSSTYAGVMLISSANAFGYAIARAAPR